MLIIVESLSGVFLRKIAIILIAMCSVLWTGTLLHDYFEDGPKYDQLAKSIECQRVFEESSQVISKDISTPSEVEHTHGPGALGANRAELKKLDCPFASSPCALLSAQTSSCVLRRQNVQLLRRPPPWIAVIQTVPLYLVNCVFLL